MATGVGRDEVFAAADALVLEGARPTIERVRQRIGRGSPNTVSPLLDLWFKGLGQRLAAVGGATDARPRDPEVDSTPTPVLLAGARMWRAAQEEAAALVQAERLENLAARQALAEERAQLETEKAQVAQAFTAMQASLDSLTSELAAARTQVQEKDAQAQSLLRDLRQARLDAQVASERLGEATASAAREREALLERAAGNERRLALDLDGARETLRATKRQLEALHESSEVAEAELSAQRERLSAELQHEHQARARQEALLEAAQGQVEALRRQLLDRESSVATMLQQFARQIPGKSLSPGLRRKLRHPRG